MNVSRFRAMGCDVVVGGASAAELGAVRTLFARRERIFSRFLPDSELNRVNAAGTMLVAVSAEFAELLDVSLRAARATGGLVTPTVGAALLAAGYDRDFSLLDPDPVPAAAAGVPPPASSVRLLGRTVRRPPGLLLDLNGVVKGRTVDDALSLLGDGFVSAGGDVAATGPLTVGLPGGASLEVRGGLATSSTERRAWVRGGRTLHHLLDPSTGSPSTSRWTSVTAAAGSCLAADVAAKAALLLGPDGPDWLDRRGVPGRFVDAGGHVVLNRTWRRAVEPELAAA